MSKSVHEINMAMCAALGIQDTSDVTAVDVKIRSNALPTITIFRHCIKAEKIEDIGLFMKEYELVEKTKC